MRRVLLALLLLLTCISVGPAKAAELKQETITAFNRYIRLTEEQARATLRATGSFFWIDGFPDAKREALDVQLRQGEIITDRLETRDGQARVEVPGGLLHHWVAMCFVPGVTLHETLKMLQDYERYPVIYKGDVTRSRLLSADERHFNVFVQMYQKSIITVVYNAEFEVSYFPLGQSRSHSRSYSKRIVEVENPGGSDESEKPIGRDRGFLWRLYSYWRLEERNGGIYVQLESIALSRRVPVLFAWLVNPLLSSLPKTYLSRILVSTRSALSHGLSSTASPRAVQERADLLASSGCGFDGAWSVPLCRGLPADPASLLCVNSSLPRRRQNSLAWSAHPLKHPLYSVPHESFQTLPLRLEKCINLNTSRVVAVGVIVVIRAMSDLEDSATLLHPLPLKANLISQDAPA